MTSHPVDDRKVNATIKTRTTIGQIISALDDRNVSRAMRLLEPASEDLRLMANLTIQIGTDKTWDQYFGKIQYTFVKREKVNMLIFGVGNNLMLITTQPDVDLEQIAQLRDFVITIYSTGMIPEKVK